MVLERDRSYQDLEKAKARLIQVELERHTAVHRARLASAERLASIGALAAGLAHELNTPLGYVTSNVNFVREALGDGAPPSESTRHELFEVLAETQQGLDRIRRVVSGFAEFSSPVAVADGLLDVREVARSVLVMVETWLIGRARLELELGAVPLVRGNSTRLRELLAHLLMHAAESVARDGGPAPAVRLRTATTPEGRLRMEVAHTGPAIPPAEREALLNPSAGGLAMWICRGIAEELGGTVAVESGEARGVALIVELPADPVPAPAPAAPGLTPPR
jgi:signal transduction histidine kinase